MTQRKQAHTAHTHYGDDELLKIEDVTSIIKCSRAQAYRLAHSGQLPLTRIGRMVRVSRRSLMEMIHRNTTGN